MDDLDSGVVSDASIAIGQWIRLMSKALYRL